MENKDRTIERQETIKALLGQRGHLVEKITGLNQQYTEYDANKKSLTDEIERIDIILGSLCGCGDDSFAETVTIRPGQVAILRHPGILTDEAFKNISESLLRAIPEFSKVIVLEENMSICIADRPDADPDADPETTDETQADDGS